MSVFHEWMWEMVERGLEDGSIGLNDVKSLHDAAREKSYEDGYTKGHKEGKNEGYLRAMEDIEREKNLPDDLDRAAGYNLSEYKE